jgi:hypothetical protein
MPYRGTEQHGVPFGSEMPPTPEEVEGGRVVRKETPPEETEPVPVRIVEPGTKVFQQWRTYQTYVTSTVRQIVNRKEDRKNLRIRNLTAEKNPNQGKGVFLGSDQMLTKQNGWFLDSGDTFVLSGEAEVWAVAEIDTEIITLAVVFEFDTEM